MFGAVQVEDTRDRIVKVPKGWAGGGKSKYCRTNGTFHVQGEGECVAVSVAHMLEHYGIKLQPEGLYWIGQRVDEVMVPHVGTTVRGVVKALHKLGIVSRYGWAKDIDTIRYWLQVHGPVLMAGPWMEGMDDTDSLGYVRLHGLYLDRHCWIVDGWGKRGFRCKNTAGREWGLDGRFWLKDEDMKSLVCDMMCEVVCVEMVTGSRYRARGSGGKE